MNYKRIKPRKIYEEVAEALIDMIKSGQLKSGDKLESVQQLAENFQVGRSAVREALSALRAMGLVEMHQGEGTYVREFDSKMLSLPVYIAVLMKKDDVKNLLEVRRILEVGAVQAAADRRTDEQLAEIKEALDQMETANDQELGEEADFRFHMAIAKASHNELLIGLMNNVSEMMVTTMRETRRLWLYSEKSTLDRLWNEHQQIYQAIEAQDGSEAQKLMLDHLQSVEEVLMNYFDEMNE
ncbi:GntR family transcriptional regulator [[Bacillus] enclensis]|uniref:Transcriptional regulator, GntR family n=2 Tax=Rossellomorea TaxID=2837508 RepID=A0A0V8HQ58_9BACI|nr:FadR/GntR family transcriptional regulator [[Bacillus] enclensis]OAT82198.1 GntR family transcriptional regulator [Bacillus sp. MKU004]QTC41802.1 FadR family transcriptional regulator [Bacillus sp. V3]QWC23874.1 FadR family transcriptional regulator [Bacillus haikouensis]KSU64700.1 GntR family transcriptional regulator [[Bacillus] enclensis]SCB73053.1 transcriptional regulator, GntR family [[Bacillus] enclensis]